MLAIGETDAEAAGSYANSINVYADENDDTYAHVAQVVGHDLCMALAAYKAKDFDSCIGLLEPVRYNVSAIGGSNAQRDLFVQILIDSSVRAGRWKLARTLLSERTAQKPKNIRAWRQLSMVLKALGDDSAAQMAAMRGDVGAEA